MLSSKNLVFFLLLPMVVIVWKACGLATTLASHLPRQAAQTTKEGTAAKVCEVASPTSSVSRPHVSQAPELNMDPHSPTWALASAAWIARDCTRQIDYAKIKTEVRGFWTDSDLYLLLVSPYTELNLWLPADNSKDRLKLWDRDVVEFFLGDDWTNSKRYKEFEIAPTGDWVDLDIDVGTDKSTADWNSGWQRLGRIDEKTHVWYAAARVPLKSVSAQAVKAGTKWRVNLYRIMASAKTRSVIFCAGN